MAILHIHTYIHTCISLKQSYIYIHNYVHGERAVVLGLAARERGDAHHEEVQPGEGDHVHRQLLKGVWWGDGMDGGRVRGGDGLMGNGGIGPTSRRHDRRRATWTYVDIDRYVACVFLV